jgi:Tfp pilus assembly PilM family ATPase
MMLKDCVVICIQSNLLVLGLRLKAIAGGKYFIANQFVQTYMESDGSGEVLEHVMYSLNFQHCDRVVVTGQLEQSGVFEIRMPKLSQEELRHAVEYELSKHIPLPLSDIVWSARIVPDEDEEIEEHSNRVRIVFMLRDNWTKFVSELQIRGLDIDAYINIIDTIRNNDLNRKLNTTRSLLFKISSKTLSNDFVPRTPNFISRFMASTYILSFIPV